jgi:GTP-binding protein HflX
MTDAKAVLTAATRTLVICPMLRSASAGSRSSEARQPEARLAEAVGLAQAIDLNVVHGEVVKLDRLRPGTLLGSGSVERLKTLIHDQEIALAVIDWAVTPVQQRNLEKEWACKVIDRTGLILEIFGARARTAEGKLQVELAALSYQRSRLVRSWTHLERQRGGFGFLGGPGESQLEIDRRLIGQRIVKL